MLNWIILLWNIWGSIDNPDEIFHAEILLSGLGAIMDVAVAIAVALSEIVTKRPEVTFRELFRSGREIGYDIMGTMINVLVVRVWLWPDSDVCDQDE